MNEERVTNYLLSEITKSAEELTAANRKLLKEANYFEAALREGNSLTAVPDVRVVQEVKVAQEKLKSLARTARAAGIDSEVVEAAADQGVAQAR